MKGEEGAWILRPGASPTEGKENAPSQDTQASRDTPVERGVPARYIQGYPKKVKKKKGEGGERGIRHGS